MYSGNTTIMYSSSPGKFWRVYCKYCNKALYTAGTDIVFDSLHEKSTFSHFIALKKDRVLEHAGICKKFKENPQTRSILVGE